MTGKKRNRLIVVVSFLLASASQSHALTYLETTDFPNNSAFDSGAWTIGTLDAGSNLVSGGLAGTCAASSCNGSGIADGRDSFLITVAAGTLLTEFIVIGTDFFSPPGLLYALELRSISGSLFLHHQQLRTLYHHAVNIAPGTYSVSLFADGPAAPGRYALLYDLGLTVSSVPEPASWAMMIAGISLLGAALRRQSVKVSFGKTTKAI